MKTESTPEIENLLNRPIPLVGIRMEQGIPRVIGSPEVFLGRRIPSPGRGQDQGVFAEWSWDGRCLTVVNDRFGMYPLFYCAKPDSIWVSPSITNVLRGNSSRELDMPALAVFYRLGYCVGDDTPFRDIRCLAPDSTLTWRDGKTELRGEARPAGGREAPAQACDFDDAVDRFRVLFAEAIARRLPDDGDFVIPISGGRDSRHILLELARQQRRPRLCVTVRYRPPTTGEDVRVARILTRRLGIDHLEIDRPPSFFHAALADIRLTNYCGGSHIWTLPVAARLSGRVRTLYDGLAGGNQAGGDGEEEDKTALYGQGQLSSLARAFLFRDDRERVIERVLERRFGGAIGLDVAVERVREELENHVEAVNPLWSFLFWNRQRRGMGSIPYAIFRDIPVVHAPFLDHALHDFLSTVDRAWVVKKRLHDETIRRSYPEWADVPYEDKRIRPTLGPSDRRYYPEARRQFWRYLDEVGAESSRQVNRAYLRAKLAMDLLLRKVESPWYMGIALHAIELEKEISS
jgi:hypothetical protein